jgi:hypothetical protein
MRRDSAQRRPTGSLAYQPLSSRSLLVSPSVQGAGRRRVMRSLSCRGVRLGSLRCACCPAVTISGNAGKLAGNPVPAPHFFRWPRAQGTGGYGSRLAPRACDGSRPQVERGRSCPRRRFRIGKQGFPIPIRLWRSDKAIGAAHEAIGQRFGRQPVGQWRPVGKLAGTGDTSVDRDQDVPKSRPIFPHQYRAPKGARPGRDRCRPNGLIRLEAPDAEFNSRTYARATARTFEPAGNM